MGIITNSIRLVPLLTLIPWFSSSLPAAGLGFGSPSSQGYGPFRPLTQEEQQSYSRPGIDSPPAYSWRSAPGTDQFQQKQPNQWDETQLRERRIERQFVPNQSHGYQFRELPGAPAADQGLPRFRPNTPSGDSPYTWGGYDGGWTRGAQAPAPVFRPTDQERKQKKRRKETEHRPYGMQPGYPQAPLYGIPYPGGIGGGGYYPLY